MKRVRIPLQLRVILLLGGALAALQLVLAGVYVATVDESVALRRSTQRTATQDAVDLKLREAATRQRDSLELFADLGRQQGYVVVEENITTTRRRGTGPRSLPGSAVSREVTRTETRMEELVENLIEYRVGSAILWYVKDAGSPEALSPEQRDHAVRLDEQTRGTANRIHCAQDGCVLLTVRPFQTRDGVQVTAVGAAGLAGLLRPPEGAAGTAYALRWAPEGQAAPADRPGAWIGPQQTLGGIELGAGALFVGVPESEDVARLLQAREFYIRVAASGVLLSLLLIALSLRGVLSRVGVLTETLPLLTTRQFGAARERLARAIGRSHARDETETLLRVAADVSVQLEELTGELQDKARKLERERDRVSLLLDTVPACVMLVDRQMAIRSANALSGRLLGLSEDRLLGTSLAELMPEADFEEFSRAARQVAESGQRRSVDASLRDGRDVLHAVDWELVPVNDPDQDEILALAAGQDVTDLRAMEQRFHWLREHDELTGLLNRDALLKRIQSAKQSGVLVYLALEREQILRAALDGQARAALARHLGQCLGQDAADDVLVAALPDRSLVAYTRNSDGAETAVDALAARIGAQPFVHDDRSFELGLRPVFVRLGGVESPETLQELLAGPELPETPGGSRWIEAAEVVSRHHEEHRFWVREIDDALAERRLFLEYQPIFALPSLQATHSEALVRMRGRDGERVPPGLFIGHAERSGQIIDLERQVFEIAIDKARELHAAGLRHPLAVNMAAQSLHDEVLLERLRQALSGGLLPPGALIFEIVETEAIRNLEAARALLQRFKLLGIRIALDDFGVGFTSFEYVRELPFDAVKIDQAFVRQLARRPQDAQLIASINELVHGLGRKTIAEGIEDRAALDIVIRLGVDAGQGFHLGRPGPDIVSGGPRQAVA